MKPTQTNMFTTEDLPLFSGTPMPVQAQLYQPEPESNLEQLQLVSDEIENRELLAKMKSDMCFQNGKFLYWPTWLNYEDVQDLLLAGYLTRSTGGPATYAAVTYTLTKKGQ